MATYYVDMAVGDDANLGTSEGSGNAWKTIDKAMNTVAAGDKVWVKASADYTETATIDTAGSAGSPIVFEGYTTTTGDGGKATIDGATTRTTGIGTSLAAGTSVRYVFKNLIIKNHTDRGVNASLHGLGFINCEIINNTGFGSVTRLATYYKCIVTGNGSGGIVSTNNDLTVIGCNVSTNGGPGIRSDTYLVAVFNVLFSNTGDAILQNGTNGVVAIIANIVDGDGKDTDSGISIKDDLHTQAILNNVIYDCTTGINSVTDVKDQAISDYNLINGNTTARTNIAAGANDVTAAPGFVNEAGNDYTPTAGSAQLQEGVDYAVLAGGGTSYIDIGAIQLQPAAGGGGALVNAGLVN